MLGLGARAVVLEGRGGARKLRHAGYATTPLSPAPDHRERPTSCSRSSTDAPVSYALTIWRPAETWPKQVRNRALAAVARFGPDPRPLQALGLREPGPAGDARGRGALRSARRRRMVPHARPGRRPDARGLPRVRSRLPEPGLGGQDGPRARVRRAVREGRGRARARRERPAASCLDMPRACSVGSRSRGATRRSRARPSASGSRRCSRGIELADVRRSLTSPPGSQTSGNRRQLRASWTRRSDGSSGKSCLPGTRPASLLSSLDGIAGRAPAQRPRHVERRLGGPR